MGASRKKKSFINILSGIGYQLFVVIISFISRTIFIHTLGNGYLGLSSLFTNILSVLSLAELGIGTAMTYSLYKPLAENDTKRIASLLKYFRKLYIVIAMTILTLGFTIIPFLGFVINLKTPIPYISFYYLLYLIDTVISYLCLFKALVLTADQKDYIIKVYRMIFDCIRLVLQLIILIVFKNFTIYLAMQILCSIGGNLAIARYASRKYPYINQGNELEKFEKQNIWKDIKAMFSYKLGGVILNNTDHLLMSILVSTEIVGLYSNYYLPIKAVTGITSSVFIALQASIGNLVVEEKAEKQYKIFKVLDVSSFWIYGFCSVCFCVLLQDFITIWLGAKFLLPINVVYIIAITYYLTGVLYPIWCFRETVGLFQHTKNILFFAALINLFFSIVLGRVWGISGILLATILARCLTNVWYEPFKLFKIYFQQPIWGYYVKQIKQFILLVFTVILINQITLLSGISNIYILFGVKVVLCILIPNTLIIGFSKNSEEFKYLFEYISTVVGKIFKIKR